MGVAASPSAPGAASPFLFLLSPPSPALEPPGTASSPCPARGGEPSPQRLSAARAQPRGRLPAGPARGLCPPKGPRRPAPDLLRTLVPRFLAHCWQPSAVAARRSAEEDAERFPPATPRYQPPLSRCQKRAYFWAQSLLVCCGSGFTGLDGAWLQCWMSLQTPRCATKLERNLRSVALWRGKINPIQPANPAFLPPCNQLYPPPNRENSLLSSSLHAPSFGDCRMRHFILSGSG
ncbi:unnamed protein product [Bubo scandiacus]